MHIVETFSCLYVYDLGLLHETWTMAGKLQFAVFRASLLQSFWSDSLALTCTGPVVFCLFFYVMRAPTKRVAYPLHLAGSKDTRLAEVKYRGGPRTSWKRIQIYKGGRFANYTWLFIRFSWLFSENSPGIWNNSIWELWLAFSDLALVW